MICLYGHNPADSITPGFASGFYKDGSPLFPGTGRFDPALFPVARISTSILDRGPGAYGLFSQHFDQWEAKYYKAHPDLKWINTTLNKIQNEFNPQ